MINKLFFSHASYTYIFYNSEASSFLNIAKDFANIAHVSHLNAPKINETSLEDINSILDPYLSALDDARFDINKEFDIINYL